MTNYNKLGKTCLKTYSTCFQVCTARTVTHTTSLKAQTTSIQKRLKLVLHASCWQSIKLKYQSIYSEYNNFRRSLLLRFILFSYSLEHDLAHHRMEYSSKRSAASLRSIILAFPAEVLGMVLHHSSASIFSIHAYSWTLIDFKSSIISSARLCICC